MYFKAVYIICFCVLPFFSTSQKITYAEPESEDSRSLQFDIVGKTGGNFHVFKQVRNKFAISVYDNQMKLIDRVPLDFLPEKSFNVDFINYPDYNYLVYQYQKRNIVYCMAVKLDAMAKKMGDLILLDTTAISVFADNKIYNTIYSEDRKQIMIYKVQKKNDRYNFTTLLLDPALTLRKKSRIQMEFEERRDVYSEFYLDNDGNFVFAKGIKSGSRELISNLSLIIKKAYADTFAIHPINLGEYLLDDLKLKVDNVNSRYLVNSFLYKVKRGNVDGLYSAVWDRTTNTQIINNAAVFGDSLKNEAKSNGSIRLAFNDYFIRQVILKRDGGFILTAEGFTSQSRVNPWNRFDYLYGSPYMTSHDYYLSSPYNNYYYNRLRSFGQANQTRYYYENISVMSFDKTGRMEWSDIVHKSQYDDESDSFLSYQLMNAGGELHFLFNELERKNQLIADHTILPSGKVIRNPTLKSLDKGFQFMPRFGKQVSSKQIIMPCTYRNYICFAKIEY